MGFIEGGTRYQFSQASRPRQDHPTLNVGNTPYVMVSRNYQATNYFGNVAISPAQHQGLLKNIDAFTHQNSPHLNNAVVEIQAHTQNLSWQKKAAAVSQYFNDHITYEAEARGRDVLQSPEQALTRRLGDCEDYAFAKAQALRKMGFPPQDIFIVGVMGNAGPVSGGDGHATLMVKIDGQFYVMDNDRNAQFKPASQFFNDGIQPRFAYNPYVNDPVTNRPGLTLMPQHYTDVVTTQDYQKNADISKGKVISLKSGNTPPGMVTFAATPGTDGQTKLAVQIDTLKGTEFHTGVSWKDTNGIPYMKLDPQAYGTLREAEIASGIIQPGAQLKVPQL